MKTFSLPLGLCGWFEFKLGLGFSFNYIPQQMGYEPFIVGQFLCFWFFVAPKCSEYGWIFDLEHGKFKRVEGR